MVSIAAQPQASSLAIVHSPSACIYLEFTAENSHGLNSITFITGAIEEEVGKGRNEASNEPSPQPLALNGGPGLVKPIRIFGDRKKSSNIHDVRTWIFPRPLLHGLEKAKPFCFCYSMRQYSAFAAI